MKYFLKKITGLIITLLIVTMLVFLAFDIIPGDPALAKLGTEATPEQVEALREEMHRRSAYSFAVISELALGLVVADYDHRTGVFRPSEDPSSL